MPSRADVRARHSARWAPASAWKVLMARPGGFSGAAGLYRGMLTEGDELRTLAQDRPLHLPVTTIGSSGGDFTQTAFRQVSAHNVTAVRLEGVGHYVAREAPELLAEHLIETFARHIPDVSPPPGG
jgi:pimeloyl-ACP methyl ester carboxylesterase